MSIAHHLRTLRSDESAATGILVGAAMPALLGAAAMAIDLGSIYLAQRQLQGIADSAAMAATEGDIEHDGLTRAQELVDKTGVRGITIDKLTPGLYRQDPSVAVADRFVADDVDPTAAKVEMHRQVPLFFGKIFRSSELSMVRAKATSQRVSYTAFSLGTSLLTLSGGIENQILSQLAGTELGLSVLDVNGLANAQVDLLGYADALKARVGAAKGETYAEVFSKNVSADQAVEAMADALGPGSSADTLRSVAASLSSQDVKLSDIVDLGPMGNVDYNSGSNSLSIDAFSLLRAIIGQGKDADFEVDLNLSALGLANVTARIIGGTGWRSSPLLTVSSAKDYVLRTSQARILLDLKTTSAISSLAQIDVPVYAELAEAQARVSDIVCDGDPDEDGVNLAVTPSLGTFAIAQVDQSAFPDLSRDVTLSPAQLVKIPAASISGFSEVDLGGLSAQTTHFSPDDVAKHVVKVVSTNDLVQGIVASLAKKIDLKVNVLGLGVGTSALTSATASQLTSVAPSLDAALNAVTQALGLRIGSADVRVDKYRCGVPQVVA